MYKNARVTYLTNTSVSNMAFYMNLGSSRKKFLWAIQIVLSIFHVFGLIFQIVGKLTFLYDSLNFTDTTAQVMDLLRDGITTVTNIVGMYCLINFIVNLNKFATLHNRTGYLPNKRVFTTIVVVLILSTISISIMHVYYISTHFKGMVWYILPSKIEYVFSNILLFSMLYFARAVKDHLTDVNEYIKGQIWPYFDSPLSFSVNSELNMDKCLYTLREITGHHEKVCDLLDSVNDKFLPLLVLIIVSVTLNALYDITMMLEFTLRSTTLNDESYALMFFGSMFLVESVRTNCLDI